MNEPRNNDWLEEVLRREEPYVDDNGFTGRVVATLPARRRRAWLRPVIIGGATFAGLALAGLVLPVQHYLVDSFVQLYRARSLSAIPLAPVALIVLLFWAALSAVASEN
jgi:hypothetical protein